MTTPEDVAAFHADFDKRHPNDRIRLFRAVASVVPEPSLVLYPGSYVDIGPSAWFDDVTYVDVDKRAARFFSRHDDVLHLIGNTRRLAGRSDDHRVDFTFHSCDYQEPLPIGDESVDVLISMYGGFVSEYCTRYVRPGGHLVTNDSHGDASMASLDPLYELVAVVDAEDGDYSAHAETLDQYLIPKRGSPPTAESLQASGRGATYATPAFVYVFRRASSSTAQT